MIGNIIALLVMLAAVFGCGWLVLRGSRAQRGLVKWPVVIVFGLVGIVVALITVLAGRGLSIVYTPRNYPVQDIRAAANPEQLARGEHLADAVCAGCHSTSQDLPLTGGKNLTDDVGLPLGDMYPPNLTPASEIAGWTDGELLRAIRLGTHKNGRPLLKPIEGLSQMSDADVQAVIAYLRHEPSVQNTVPETNPSLLLAVFLGAGLFNIDASDSGQPVLAPPKGATLEYGKYLVSFTDCKDCHGANLDGQVSGPAPAGPDLGLSGKLTLETFISFVRTRGTGPSATATAMPWKQMAKLDDEELGAMYLVLSGLNK